MAWLSVALEPVVGTAVQLKVPSIVLLVVL